MEYSFRLGDGLMLHGGHTKWPLRRVLEGRLDDQVRLAPKRAVVTPQKEWMRGPLRSAIRQRLEYSKRIGAAIYVIAERNDKIVIRDLCVFDEGGQRCETAMNV